MNALLSSPFLSANLERLGWTLLHFLWQGTLVAGVLALELAALRRASARLRYLAGVVAAAAALLMPVITFVVLHPIAAERVARPPAAATAAPWTDPAPGRAAPVFAAPADAQPAAGNPTSKLGQPASHPAAQRERTLPRWWRSLPLFTARMRTLLPWGVAAWLCGVSLLSFRLLASWWQAQRLCRHGVRTIDPRWQTRLDCLARKMGVKQAVRLLESTLAEVPAVVGALWPVILLPVGMLTGLSAAQIEMILAHELAHIRRQDYLVNLGLNLFETLGFYHPAVWWIAARVREEREHACDDLAVQASGGDRLGYVRALATLEEMRGTVPGVALAATSGGRGTLLARARRLLGVAPVAELPDGRTTGWLAGAVALLFTVVLTLASFRPLARAQEAGKTPPPVTKAAGESVASNELTGRVVDEAGQPVAGAFVYDDAGRDDDGQVMPSPLVTGADGSFRVPRLRHGGQWRWIGARKGEEAVGWLDIGAGHQPAAFNADNVLTKPVVLRARRYALHGVCADKQGNPLAGAQVAATSLPSEGSGSFGRQVQYPEESIYQFWLALTTRSDAQGMFSLPVPLPEGMQVEISAPGRQTVYPFRITTPGAPPVLDLGRVTLPEAGGIAGRIVLAPRGGSEARPLKGAVLLAVNAAEQEGASVIETREYENVPFSDEQGRYQIVHLPPGIYTVYLFSTYDEKPGPESTTMAAAENVIVRAGETTPLDLRTVPGRHLRVRAADLDTNRPAHNLPVHFVGPSRPASASLNTGAALSDQGECTLQVAPGHYRIFISKDYGLKSPELASAEVDVPEDRDPDPVVLQTRSGPHLRGRAQDVQGRPIPLSGLAVVNLLETSPAPGGRQWGGQSSDGSFDLPLTKTGIRARLAVDVAGYRPFLSPEFTVTETPEPMTVTLETAPDLVIRGRAVDQDGHPVARGYVTGTIFPADGLSYSVSLGSGIPGTDLYTDQDGRFETHRIGVGAKFRLEVQAGGRMLAASADWVQLERSDGGDFDIEMHAVPATRDAAPDVPIGPRDLAGHVVDARGKPIPGALVSVSGGSQDPGAATTNATGGFRFPDFGDRHYLYLAVAKEGYATHWVTDLDIGKDLTVSLENNTRLRGQLAKPDGSPAGPAHLVLRTSRPTGRAFMVSPIRDLRVDRQTDTQGAYDFPVEPGKYDVEITSADGSLVARHEGVQATAGQVDALPAALSPGLTLRLQTLDRMTGQPAAGVKFHIVDMTDDAAMGIKPGSRKQTDGWGFVEWEHLFPGPLELLTSDNDVYQRIWSYDPRVTYPRDLPRDKAPTGNEGTIGQLILNLTPGQNTDPVVLQVERGVKVFGKVLDVAGQPAINVSLRAVMDRSGRNGANSKYPWSDLVPFHTYEQTGSYSGYIPAGNGLPARIDARPQDKGQGGTLSEPFDSQPGDERQVTIRLNKGGVVEGTVVDQQGKPLPNVGVSSVPLDHLDSQEFCPWEQTDSQGRFRFEHVRPTEYEVTTTIVPHMSVGDELPQEKRRISVPAGERVEMGNLHFDPAGWTGPAAPLPIPSPGPAATPVAQPVPAVIPAPSPAPDIERLTARVKVVDEDGKPIAGETITPSGLRGLRIVGRVLRLSSGPLTAGGAPAL